MIRPDLTIATWPSHNSIFPNHVRLKKIHFQTRERVPLDWAISTGNQGVALILLAERLGDVPTARSAVQQIEIALATMRDGNAPAAAYYEAQLPKARSLFDRLTSRSE